METTNSKLMVVLGIFLNALSLVLYNIFARIKQTDELIIFIVYFIGAAYFIAITINNTVSNGWHIFKLNARHFFLLLSLLTISCFTINLEINVFSEMPNWLFIAFFTTYASLGLQIFFPNLQAALHSINFFFLGIGSILALYFTLYLMPTIPFAFVGLIFFGFTIHFLMPIILLITLLVHVIKAKKTFFDALAYYLGIALPVAVIIFYIAAYNSANEKIHSANATIITRPESDLPSWVLLSQSIDNNSITESILKGDFVYDMGTTFTSFSPDFGSFSEKKLHNPFIVMAASLTNDLEISGEERIKILRTLFGNRHNATQKLWTGKDLKTNEILSNIRIYPEFRLAYIEKIISVKNANQYEWNQQEALYTFNLPEGSVASSLSLWINGEEQKSRLTTKNQADSAYTTVVGVEVRDPSVMHWQEGNKLVVNVFPCTPQENRRFKIGITIPLKVENGKLKLENVNFEGPSAESALETTVLKIETEKVLENLNIPAFFDEISENNYQYTGAYVENWEIEMDKLKTSDKSFSFGGNSYSIVELKPQNLKIDTENIFLDINNSWTKEEFQEVLSLFEGKHIYVYFDEIVKISEQNNEKLFEKLNSLNFSLFPFHKIEQKSAFVISKSTENSPNYGDLKDSDFIKKLSNYIATKNQNIYFFNLSQNLSPYLQTLKQFRILDFAQGNLTDLQKIAKTQTFSVIRTNSNQVSVPEANMLIEKTQSITNSGAPDHLLRMFAYNKIVQAAGRNFFDEQFITDSLIGLAEEAYVVSPVSSFIVLESKADYERFAIDENQNTLGNASVLGHGGVPEPHEWVLIVLSILVVMITSFKKLFGR